MGQFSVKIPRLKGQFSAALNTMEKTTALDPNDAGK